MAKTPAQQRLCNDVEDVSAMLAMTPSQQGEIRERNEGNNASAMTAKMPAQCWQPRGCDEDNDANITLASMLIVAADAASCCWVLTCDWTTSGIVTALAATDGSDGGSGRRQGQWQWRSKAPATVGGHGRSAMDDCGPRQQTAAAAGIPLREEDGEVADREEDHARKSEGRGGFVFPSFCRALW